MQGIASAKILGCRVDAINRVEAIAGIVRLANEDAASLVVTLGTEMVVRAQNDERFRHILSESALSLCDTVGVLHAARLRDVFIPELVTGVDLVEPLCGAFATAGVSVYFLGAKGDTAEKVARVMVERYPNLQIAGYHHGYFSPNEDAAVAALIAKSGAKALFVGMGSPRQEYWIAENLRAGGCNVGIGVGGSFDVLAGNVPRAPEAWRKLNLEWFYRLLREPRRWKRQLALPHFVWLALREAVTEEHGRLRA